MAAAQVRDAGVRSPGAAASVAAVAVLQVAAMVVTLVAWFVATVFAGTACSPDCDWGAAAVARWLYLGGSAATFVASVVAAVAAWRTGRDLACVPLVGAGLVVAAFAGGLALHRAATG